MKDFGESPQQQQGLQLQLFRETEVGKVEENQGPLHSRLQGNVKRDTMGDCCHSGLPHLLDAER